MHPRGETLSRSFSGTSRVFQSAQGTGHVLTGCKKRTIYASLRVVASSRLTSHAREWHASIDRFGSNKARFYVPLESRGMRRCS